MYNPGLTSLDYLKNPTEYNSLALDRGDLDQIVGKDYEYTVEVRDGVRDCWKFTERRVELINVKTMFHDGKNMKVQELRWRLGRKQKVESLFTEEEIEEARRLEEKMRVQREEEEAERAERRRVREAEIT